MTVRLVIPGKPHGKSRPRFGNGRAFTDPKATSFVERVHIAWREQGSPTFCSEAVRMRVSVHRRRPRTHYRKDGLLSQIGVAAPLRPIVTPDADNFAGSGMDALNNLAYYDDRQVVSLTAERFWSDQDDYLTVDIERFVA